MSLWRSRRKRRPVLLSLLVAWAVAMAAYAGAVTLLSPEAADPALSGAGVQVQSTGTGGASAEGGQNPAISADGRQVVFQSKADLPSLTPLHARAAASGTWRVYARDRVNGITTLLSDPAVNSTAPSVSADGRRVAYRVTTRLLQGLNRATTVVVDRDVSAGGTLDRTGNVKASDFADAAPELAESFPGLCGQDCGPRISADGSTVVYPSLTSPVSTDFVVTVAKDGGSIPTQLNTNLIDLNAVTGTAVYAHSDVPVSVIVATRSVVPGQTTADFTDRLTVQNPYGEASAFSVGPKTCDAFGTCRTTLTFDPAQGCPSGGPGQRWDRLVIDGPTSSGHSSIVLKADCGSQAGRAACGSQPGSDGFYDPGLSAADLARLPVQLGTQQTSAVSGTYINLGSQSAGHAFILAVPTRNLRGTVDFGTLDCQPIQLVDPGATARAAAAKLTGADSTAVPLNTQLDGTDRGTLYFLVNPPFVPPSVRDSDLSEQEPVFAAQLRMDADEHGAGQGSFALSVVSVRQIIEARRDTSSTGGFTPGPAELVSRGTYAGDNATELVDAAQPSVSADGRTVAYTRYGHPDAALDQPAVVTTTRGSTGTWSGGGLVPSPLSAAYDTDSPSLSADGSSVAYVRRPVPAASGQSAQIAVTSLKARSSVTTVSTNAEGTPGDGDSSGPVLSPDGRVVAFVSTAGNLTDDPGASGPQLYSRTVSDQRGIARIGPADVAGSAAGLSENGALAVFATAQSLLASDTNGQSDVYVREAPGQLTVKPSTVDFGTLPGSSTTPLGLPVTLSNAGPGPVVVTSAVPAAPFTYDASCVGQTIQAGESCTSAVSLTPGTSGTYTGVLRIEATTAGGDTALSAQVALKAQVTAAPAGPSTPVSPQPSASASTSGPPRVSNALAVLTPIPTVARPGRVLTVTGKGFLPGIHVNLTWGSFGPVDPVVVGADGTFTGYIDVPTSQETGERAAITAADGRGTLLAYTDLLVELPPMQPPSFKNRS
ncbi:hypothetical protein [Streptomyces sp. NPDC051014]|uniref:hypothetical protein n=1 Tax=Streptomyces sp. NPDC051014 TaxID=3155751 RepID=UPI0033F01A97